MIPIHDARGRMVGFAGRILGDGEPKYLNSPDSDHFDKGRLLFNLHRAAPAARGAAADHRRGPVRHDRARPGRDRRNGRRRGTALTEHQLERAWRVAHCPVLLFDGDAAGRKAALRAAERAMPHVGPGKSLAIARCPRARIRTASRDRAARRRSRRRSPPPSRWRTGCGAR
jgi:DNA primase